MRRNPTPPGRERAGPARRTALGLALGALALAACGGEEAAPGAAPEPPAASKGIVATLRENPCAVQARVLLAEELHRAARFADQLKILGDGVQRCPDELSFLNDYAYRLATLPDDGLRDGARALELAQQLIERSGDRSPAYLDTLAAAHAETGDFESALALADEALQLLAAGQAPESVVAVFRSHRERFEARQPVRE